MRDGQYAAKHWLLIEHGIDPAVFTKSQKFVVQESCKNYKLVKGKLCYKEQIQEWSDRDRLVVKRSEIDRVFSSITSLQEDTVGGIL